MDARADFARSAFVLGMSHVQSAIKRRTSNPDQSEASSAAFDELLSLAETDIVLASAPPEMRAAAVLRDVSFTRHLIQSAIFALRESRYPSPATMRQLTKYDADMSEAQNCLRQAVANGSDVPQLIVQFEKLPIRIVNFDIPLNSLSFRMKQFAGPTTGVLSYAFTCTHPLIEGQSFTFEFLLGNCNAHFRIDGLNVEDHRKVTALLGHRMEFCIVQLRGKSFDAFEQVTVGRFVIPLAFLRDRTAFTYQFNIPALNGRDRFLFDFTTVAREPFGQPHVEETDVTIRKLPKGDEGK
jgi:hypothetical protein